MFTSLTSPSQLLLAIVGAAHKGHEYSAQESNETKDKVRGKKDLVSQAEMLKAKTIAQGTSKGTLA